MKQEKDQVKQTAAQVWKNNWFLIKLCMVASPGYVIFAVLDSVRNQISISFPSGGGVSADSGRMHYAGNGVYGLRVGLYAGEGAPENT